MTTMEFRKRQRALNEWSDKATLWVIGAVCTAVTVGWAVFLAKVVLA